MKHTAKKISIVALLAISTFSYLSSSTAQAKEGNVVSSGTITFVGAIVFPPCETGAVNNSIQTKCWNNQGKEIVTETSIKKLKVGSHELPNHRGTQNFKWISEEKKLGLYTVSYN